MEPAMVPGISAGMTVSNHSNRYCRQDKPAMVPGIFSRDDDVVPGH